MTEKQITEEILRYLKDVSYNYAVLIDGEWGSGKTFFANNILTKAINKQEVNLKTNRSVKYISLYGCKDMTDVQENIAVMLPLFVASVILEASSVIAGA